MRIALLGLALMVVASTGCNKNGSAVQTAPAVPAVAPEDAEEAAKSDLNRFASGFQSYCDATNGSPLLKALPANLEPLEKYLGEPLSATFKTGKYKVFWSARATQMILACEKDAETKGGWICTRHGDVKKMTAAEIQKELGK